MKIKQSHNTPMGAEGERRLAPLNHYLGTRWE
jgi:hypothetical protein